MKAYITAITRTIMILTISCAFAGRGDENHRSAIGQSGDTGSKSKSFDTISPEAFANPPMRARPGAYWCWLTKLKFVLEDNRFSSVCVGMQSVSLLTSNVAVSLDKTKLSQEDVHVLREYAETTCSSD